MATSRSNCALQLPVSIKAEAVRRAKADGGPFQPVCSDSGCRKTRIDPGRTSPGASGTDTDRLPVAQLHRELKRVFFGAVANQLGADGARGAERVAKGSPQWMRHTFATHAIESVPADVVGSVLGHASMVTTTLYTRTELKRKVRALRGLVCG